MPRRASGCASGESDEDNRPERKTWLVNDNGPALGYNQPWVFHDSEVASDAFAFLFASVTT